MQDTFGKKLEEARTRQGISIKQAAEATKIRSDFLESFETDHGNFDMPMVYKRGFIKLYARHLRLNPDEILTEFDAYNNHSTRYQKRQKETPRENFGRIELNESTHNSSPDNPVQATLDLNASKETENENSEATPRQTIQSIQPQTPKHENEPSTPKISPETKSLYLKVGLIFGGTLAAFTLIAILITSLFKSSPDSPEANQGLPSPHTFAEEAKSTHSTDLKGQEELKLSTNSDVQVIVRQEADKQRIFAGVISESAPITVTRKGPVKIHFSNGLDLLIEKANGEKVRPGREGSGWIEI